MVADLLAIRIINYFLRKILPDYDLSPYIEAITRNLPLETDFRAERQNGERMQRLLDLVPLRGSGVRLRIPSLVPELCARKVLTMEYISGLSNAQSSPEAANLFSDFVASSLFVHGLLHADLHGGNVAVRSIEASTGLEVVVMDHGMYHQISENTRRSLCDLYLSIGANDPELGTRACVRLGFAAPSAAYKAISDLTLESVNLGGIANFGSKMKDLRLQPGHRGASDLIFVMRVLNLSQTQHSKLLGSPERRLRTHIRRCIEGNNVPSLENPNLTSSEVYYSSTGLLRLRRLATSYVLVPWQDLCAQARLTMFQNGYGCLSWLCAS
ncbi:MAG: hypothetical protein KVP17_005001 [Porospora cf. gigantea B]|nr:MAG: hypothetical protein KVP17_005001 [Porospora cf. gigantea B]